VVGGRETKCEGVEVNGMKRRVYAGEGGGVVLPSV